jgi:hypothetical protein
MCDGGRGNRINAAVTGMIWTSEPDIRACGGRNHRRKNPIRATSTIDTARSHTPPGSPLLKGLSGAALNRVPLPPSKHPLPGSVLPICDAWIRLWVA